MNNAGRSYLDEMRRGNLVGIGAGTRVFRVTGIADGPGRGTVGWTMVRKVLTLDKLSSQSTSTGNFGLGEHLLARPGRTVGEELTNGGRVTATRVTTSTRALNRS